MEIYCQCGHELETHNDTGCNEYIPDKWNEYIRECQCDLSFDVVEARYWAGYYYNKCKTAQSEKTMLETRLQVVVETLEEYLKNIDEEVEHYEIAGVPIQRDSEIEKLRDALTKIRIK